MPDRRKRLADIAFALALMLYVLYGTTQVPPHADEYMYMALARDFFLLRDQGAAALAYAPPIEVDTLQHLRLLNGTVHKNLVGILWAASGRTAERLPGIYAWAMPLAWNIANGNVPSDAELHLARWASAILTALGVIPIFMLGWHLRLRALAYPAALLYALHPVILLNGRRAMQEGSLIFFSLFSMYWLVALIVAEHSATARGFMVKLPAWARYGGLGILIGLTVASKHTGLIVAAAALLTALLTGIVRDSPPRPLRPILWVGFTALVSALTWFALSPHFWNAPLAALRALLTERSALLSAQASDLAHRNLRDRLTAILTQPFLSAPQYFESPSWAGLLDEPIAAYQSSATNGWDWGTPIGLILTALAALGLLSLIAEARRRNLIAWAILIWAGAAALACLAVPMNWQRYYLPFILVAIILAAEGLGRLLVRRESEASQRRTA
ncbi:MAG: phospholipid carrier-dependent glycosyltransferase [Chloroflexota bacterium]|jgi:4-amino-4-deoxy-L-arabinose transferase-like glycosyltransferase|nr:MAG: phospholipid carrier-dependent glycosyltransferase [Chloroflexota bacterium]